MNATIRLFDDVALDFSIARRDDGSRFIRAVFPKFLGRPGGPHLSLFGEPRPGEDKLSWHFTAWSGGFRHWFKKLAPAKLVAVVKRYEAVAARKFEGALQAADLDALDAEGWTVHAADVRVLWRWVRLASRSPEFRVDEKMVEALAVYVLRNHASPLWLRTLPSDQYGYCIAIRSDESGELQSRVLFHFPDGYWRASASAGGEPECVHKPGWYQQELSGLDDETLHAMLPVETLQKAGKVLSRLLKRFKRRPDARRFKGGLHPIVSRIFGIYAGDLLQMSLGAAILRREGECS